MTWISWLLVVKKEDIAVVTRRYDRASKCCDAMAIAFGHYSGKNESVTLQMKSEFGQLILEVKTGE